MSDQQYPNGGTPQVTTTTTVPTAPPNTPESHPVTGGDITGLTFIGLALVIGGWAMGRRACKRWIAR